MDRQLVYPGAIPLETDILNTNKNAMVGLSKLAAAVLGTTTLVNGFTCIPTGPASLQVQVTAGEIYSLQNTDGTAYSSLAADTVNQIVKQGIQLGTITLSAPAPATAGQSINYLVQVTYQDADLLPVVLPYYNASNPTQAYSGPNNAGTANNTVRKGVATVGIKAGISAATGSQVTPAPDAGYTGLFVVTVANGQTQITSPNITTLAGAPFLNSTLLGLSPAFTVSPTAPTPAFGDNTTKVATTNFINLIGFNAGGVTLYNVNTTLTAADFGKSIYTNTSAAITLTLPAVVSQKVISISNLNTGITTILSGTANINAKGVIGVTSITLAQGESVQLVSDGTSWIQLNFSPSVLKPTFAAYQSTAQSLPQAIYTKLQFQTKEFDVGTYFDAATNFRYQPLVAGYYQVSGGFGVSGATQLSLILYKNGGTYKGIFNTGATANTANGSALVFLNGSTDYIELFGFQGAAAQNTSIGIGNTYFQAVLVRSA